jgi:hypothetical protein
LAANQFTNFQFDIPVLPSTGSHAPIEGSKEFFSGGSLFLRRRYEFTSSPETPDVHERINMSPRAEEAYYKILNLRNYTLPQSAIAEQRILSKLNVTDFAAVVEALRVAGTGSVANG